MWERILRIVTILSQVVVVVGFLLGLLGWASGLIDSTLDDLVVVRINEQLADPNTTLGKLQSRIPETGRSPEPAFGDWRPVVVGTAHVAETDGFLCAFSGGRGDIGSFLLQTGTSRSNLETRSRGGQYQGATIPVKQGQHYKVTMDSGNKGTLTAFWLPIQ